MIKSFKHRGLEKLFLDGSKKGIQSKHSEKLEDILDILDAAANIKDLNFPGSALHQLKGKLKAFWDVKFAGKWRVIFKFKNGDAFEVEYIDYH